jgi:hypothetical protein
MVGQHGSLLRDADQRCLDNFSARIGEPTLTESARIGEKLLETYEVVYNKWPLRRLRLAHSLVFRLGS